MDRYIHRCFVSNKILNEDCKVGYLYREESKGAFKNDIMDSGWNLLSGDESDDYLDNSDNLSIVSLGAILSIDDRFVALLDNPVGSAFVWDKSTSTYVAAE